MQGMLECRWAVSQRLLKQQVEAVTLNREAVSECEALPALMKLHTPARHAKPFFWPLIFDMVTVFGHC